LPRFHPDHDDIHDADLGRVLGGDPGLDHKVTVRAVHPQAVAGQRLEMVPPGQQGHLRAGLRQPPSHIGSHGSCPKNGYTHRHLAEIGNAQEWYRSIARVQS
jgi:hypothetical protein